METTKQHAHNVAPPDAISAIGAYPSPSMGRGSCSTATTAAGQVGLTPEHQKILESRGLDVEILAAQGWRSSSQYSDGRWIEIPYLKNGKEVNCKYRTIVGEKDFRQVKDGEKRLYNLDALQGLAEGSKVVITEGEMDCIVAMQCGFVSLSVPDGAPSESIEDSNSPKYDYLDQLPKHFEYIIASDGDGAGINLLHDLSLRIGKARCRWVDYPDGCKDLNDIFLKHGRDGVLKALHGAQYVKVEGINRMSELPPVVEHPALSPEVNGLEIKFRRGDFSIVTGIPSHGKTTLVNAITTGMVRHHKWNITYASFEQNPLTEHRDALRNIYHEKPVKYHSEQELKQADEWIDKKFSFIVPSDNAYEDITLHWLLERCATAVLRYNADMIVIDPWNEMDHIREQGETLTEYVGSCIKLLKRFARQYQVHVMVVAHPAKMRRNQDGEYPIPSLYDISDSQHWYNKADIGLVIHRPDKDMTLVRFAKSRYHKIFGTPDDFELGFNSYEYRYFKQIGEEISHA